ncbi:hypothetical protein ABFT23_14575 [Nocardioides sp. C4-1]|uniref:hypothetical protein n=1 Tax=Nocardioides sp. C4-1 TaxID=3151851 RepID=UPI0032674E43
MGKDDDDAWQAIVDNYGDRPELDLDDPPAAEPDPEPVVERVERRDEPEVPRELGGPSWDDAYPDSDWDDDRFVPPPPPPLPTTSPDRMAAWAGVFGSPAILLVCLILGIGLPQLVAYLLVAAFVGGFIYLVVTMTREPRDPDDDGAVL